MPICNMQYATLQWSLRAGLATKTLSMDEACRRRQVQGSSALQFRRNLIKDKPICQYAICHPSMVTESWFSDKNSQHGQGLQKVAGSRPLLQYGRNLIKDKPICQYAICHPSLRAGLATKTLSMDKGCRKQQVQGLFFNLGRI